MSTPVTAQQGPADPAARTDVPSLVLAGSFALALGVVLALITAASATALVRSAAAATPDRGPAGRSGTDAGNAPTVAAYALAWVSAVALVAAAVLSVYDVWFIVGAVVAFSLLATAVVALHRESANVAADETSSSAAAARTCLATSTAALGVVAAACIAGSAYMLVAPSSASVRV